MKKKVSIKKILLICVLLANVCFICLKGDTFKSQSKQLINTESQEQDVIKSEETIVLKQDSIVEQEFTATGRKIGKIEFSFRNHSPHESTGKVRFALLDEHKQEVYSDTLDISLVKNDSITIFDLSGNTETINSNYIVSRKIYSASYGIRVDKGEKYILQISLEGVQMAAPLELYLSDTSLKTDNILSVDGEEIADRQIHSTAVYYQFTYVVFAALIMLLMIGIVMILLPWNKIDDYVQKRWEINWTLSRVLSSIMFVVTPFVCMFLNCKIVDMRTTQILKLLIMPRGWLSLLTIAIIWWGIYVLCNRIKYTTVITTVMFAVFAIINYALIQFRAIPFLATDLANVGTAMDVASSYSLTFDKPSIWVITIATVWCCVAMAFVSEKGVTGKRRIVNLLLLSGFVLIFNHTFFNSSYLKDHHIKVSGFNPKAGYQKYGCVLGFMSTVVTSRMEKPESYSVEAVKEIMTDYTSDEAGVAKITEQTPNVIYVMNESFADLSIIGDLGLSEDCMPFYRSLTENTIKGNLLVSAFGGQTANTEFEVLTGNTAAFLPYYTIAYAGMIKDNIPSAASSLADAGYVGNTIFHPGMADAYNRNKVYPYMEFEKYLSVDAVENPRNIRSYLSDEHNYEILINDYEQLREGNKENPYFMYNITIQNHGGYGPSTGNVSGDITLSNVALATEGQQRYANLIKKSDDALKSLIQYYKKQEEPTVIVFFGDHHPSLTDAMYKKVYEGNSTEGSKLENYVKKYTVPFMIWANYDIEEQSGVELSTNYLTAYMKQQIGISMTGYEKYLMELYKKVPVVTGNFYKGDDGQIYKWDTETESVYSELLEEYRLLQYNGL